MMALLGTIVIFAGICWALCEFVSTFVGMIFILAAMVFMLKMTKELFK